MLTITLTLQSPYFWTSKTNWDLWAAVPWNVPCFQWGLPAKIGSLMSNVTRWCLFGHETSKKPRPLILVGWFQTGTRQFESTKPTHVTCSIWCFVYCFVCVIPNWCSLCSCETCWVVPFVRLQASDFLEAEGTVDMPCYPTACGLNPVSFVPKLKWRSAWTPQQGEHLPNYQMTLRIMGLVFGKHGLSLPARLVGPVDWMLFVAILSTWTSRKLHPLVFSFDVQSTRMIQQRKK